MVVADVNETREAGEGVPRATFHVVPPPPPRPRTWTRELAIALGLGVLLNLLVLLPLLFIGPRQTPPADEPSAIEVEIIRESPPEPEPQPRPEPRSPFNFGSDDAPDRPGDTDRLQRGAAPPRDTEPQAQETPTPTPTPPKPEQTSVPDLPAWARTIERSYATRAPDGGRRIGRGDEYGRMLQQRLNANLVLPRGLDRTRIVRPEAIVSFDRSGRLIGLKLVRSSGSAALDNAMLEAIARSFPVPPVPADVEGESQTLPLVLDFH